VYVIRPERKLEAEVKRIARHQVRQAIDELSEFGEHPELAIHNCRKHCKKIRGLVRLVRPALGRRYRQVNITFRDASSRLSGYRDAHALLKTFDTVVAPGIDHRVTLGIDHVRAGLERRASTASQTLRHNPDDLDEALQLLQDGHEMIDDWRLKPRGFGSAVTGLTNTYRAGRHALEQLLSEPTPDAFHEYRKQVKYTWYQLRLLEAMAPSMLTPTRECAGALGDTLGKVNDLAVMATWLDGDPGGFGGSRQAERARTLIDDMRFDLEQRSISVGLRFHAEEPDALAKRIEHYRSVWREHGPEMAIGPSESTTDQTSVIALVP
jgi:CHAD domain-containing protein